MSEGRGPLDRAPLFVVVLSEAPALSDAEGTDLLLDPRNPYLIASTVVCTCCLMAISMFCASTSTFVLTSSVLWAPR